MPPEKTRPPNCTSVAIAASVRMTATTGSHHAVAPMAMRLGIASIAVAGKNDTTFAQTVDGLPIAAKQTK